MSHHGNSTGENEVSIFFLNVLLQVYGEYEHVFRKKSNTAAAAKERELAWEKIAARVNV